MKKKYTADENKRRYYLHRRLKRVCKLNIKTKEIFVTDDIVSAFSFTQQQQFAELKSVYHYSAQYVIPQS